MAPTELLIVEIESVGEAEIVHLVGEVDLSTVGRFERAVKAARHRERLVVDLSGVEFMDSTGVNAIVDICRDRSHARLGAVELTNAPALVSKLFEITGLDRLRGVTITSAPPASVR